MLVNQDAYSREKILRPGITSIWPACCEVSAFSLHEKASLMLGGHPQPSCLVTPWATAPCLSRTCHRRPDRWQSFIPCHHHSGKAKPVQPPKGPMTRSDCRMNDGDMRMGTEQSLSKLRCQPLGPCSLGPALKPALPGKQKPSKQASTLERFSLYIKYLGNHLRQ